MLIHPLLLSIVQVFCLATCIHGYQILLNSKYSTTLGYNVTETYTIVSSSSDPPIISADTILYCEDTGGSFSLNSTVVIHREEQSVFSLAGVSYPTPGMYTIRLLETSPPRRFLAESSSFEPPGFETYSSFASILFSTSTSSAGSITISAVSSIFPSSSSYHTGAATWDPYLSSASFSFFQGIPTGFGEPSASAVGPPVAAILGGVLGALLTLTLSLLVYLCRRRRIKFQRLKRQDSPSGNPTAMYSHPSSSAFLKSYSSQSRGHQISTEAPSDPFSGGILYSSRDDSGSALASSSPSTNPVILEELNSLRAKIKDLERLQQSMPEAPADVKDHSTPLFLSYQHSGTESLPHYDSVNDTHNLFGHQPHIPGSTKTQCFCSSCSSV